MYRYQKKQGAEDKTFSQDGVKNLPNGIVESDHELDSQYLTPIQEQPADSATLPTPQNPPAVNPAPTPPVAAPVLPSVPPQNEQTANTEANK